MYRCSRGGSGARDVLEVTEEEGAAFFIALSRDLAFLSENPSAMCNSSVRVRERENKGVGCIPRAHVLALRASVVAPVVDPFWSDKGSGYEMQIPSPACYDA